MADCIHFLSIIIYCILLISVEISRCHLRIAKSSICTKRYLVMVTENNIVGLAEVCAPMTASCVHCFRTRWLFKVTRSHEGVSSKFINTWQRLRNSTRYTSYYKTLTCESFWLIEQSHWHWPCVSFKVISSTVNLSSSSISKMQHTRQLGCTYRQLRNQTRAIILTVATELNGLPRSLLATLNTTKRLVMSQKLYKTRSFTVATNHNEDVHVCAVSIDDIGDDLESDTYNDRFNNVRADEMKISGTCIRYGEVGASLSHAMWKIHASCVRHLQPNHSVLIKSLCSQSARPSALL